MAFKDECLSSHAEKESSTCIESVLLCWPCILKFTGDDELIYVADEAALMAELNGLICCDGDMLIDSAGCCFSLGPCGRFEQGLRTEQGVRFEQEVKCEQAVNGGKGCKGYTVVGRYRFSLLDCLMDAKSMSALIQAHEFCRAQTCLIKIQFPTVQAAIAALASPN